MPPPITISSIIHPFDVSKPGAEVDYLKGGIVGGYLV
jgi:translation initiation factor 2 gamma subunit (eIF-2gamma)